MSTRPDSAPRGVIIGELHRALRRLVFVAEQPQGAQLGALKRWNAQSRSRGRDAVKNHPKQVPVPLPSGAGK